MNGEKYYEHLIRSVELLTKTDLNALWIVGPPGIGKSLTIDETLARLDANHLVFRGDMSDATLHAFLFQNSDKILVFRDVIKFLTRLNYIDIFKALSEPRKVRVVSRNFYADHGVPNNVSFSGKIIFEMNAIPNRFKEDLDALFSRGIFCELVLSKANIMEIMREKATTSIEKEVTEHLFEDPNRILNMRLQEMVFNIAKMSDADGRNYIQEVDLFLSTLDESRNILYTLAGETPVKKIDLVKYLMKRRGYSISTAYRKIDEWIYMGEIFDDGLGKRSKVCVKAF